MNKKIFGYTLFFLLSMSIAYGIYAETVCYRMYDNHDICINETAITGTTLSCSNITGASYDVCAGGGTGGGKIGDLVYLYNDSTTMYLNETKLNATIDVRSVSASDTNESNRFANLVHDCNTGNYVQNITSDGTPECSADLDTDTTIGNCSVDGSCDIIYKNGSYTTGKWCSYNGTTVNCQTTPVVDTDTDTQLSENEVEAFIFDADNTADLGMGGYEINNVENITFKGDTVNHFIEDNSTCVIIKGDTSEIHIC